MIRDILSSWFEFVVIAVLAGVVLGLLLGIAVSTRDNSRALHRIEQRQQHACTWGASSTMVTIDKNGTVRQAAPSMAGCRP